LISLKMWCAAGDRHRDAMYSIDLRRTAYGLDYIRNSAKRNVFLVEVCHTRGL
jgi:hypothetical protein